MRTLLNKSGNFFFNIRNALFPVVFLLLIVIIRPGIFLSNRDIDLMTTVLGVIITLCGLAFRFSVIGFAYIQRGGRDKKPYADKLQCQGFYAHTRNPMYVGNMLICFGLALAYGSLPAFIILVAYFSYVYLSIIVAEEDYLRAKFGADYDAYCQDVPSFFPKLSGIHETFKDMSFDWRKSLRKDYGTIFGGITAIIFIHFYKQYLLHGNGALYPGIISELILLSLYLYVRFLKKTKRLGTDN